MRIQSRFLLLTLLAAGPLAAWAQVAPLPEISHDRIAGIERAIETGSAVVLMPTSENGTITVNNCANCRAERLTVNGRTRYYAGAQLLSLLELKSLLSSAHPVSMTVFVDLKDPVALRVVADVQAPSRSKAH